MEGYFMHHERKIPRRKTPSRVKFFKFYSSGRTTVKVPNQNFRQWVYQIWSKIMEGYFTHRWRKVPRRNTPSRVNIFEFYSSGRTMVKSSESEFLAAVRQKSWRDTLRTIGAKFCEKIHVPGWKFLNFTHQEHHGIGILKFGLFDHGATRR